MVSNSEEKNTIRLVNNKALIEVLTKNLGNEVDNLKIASIDNFKIFQGKVQVLEEVLKLIKV